MSKTTVEPKPLRRKGIPADPAARLAFFIAQFKGELDKIARSPADEDFQFRTRSVIRLISDPSSPHYAGGPL